MDKVTNVALGIIIGSIITVAAYSIDRKPPAPAPQPSPVPIINLVPGNAPIMVQPIDLPRPQSYVVLFVTHTNTIHDNHTHTIREVRTVHDAPNPYFYWEN